MSRSKYINTFETTADYNNYIESAIPEFPNVGYDKQAGKVNIRRTSPNNYQIWGTTTATSNFNIKLNSRDVEVTVDPALGEFYLQGWTGTLTSLQSLCYGNTDITSIKKFDLDISNVTSVNSMFDRCSALTYVNMSTIYSPSISGISAAFRRCGIQVLDISGWDLSNSNSTGYSGLFEGTLTDIYITVEGTLNRLTNNLTSQGGNDYVPSSATIHYNDVDYKWQNNAWTPQS